MCLFWMAVFLEYVREKDLRKEGRMGAETEKLGLQHPVGEEACTWCGDKKEQH